MNIIYIGKTSELLEDYLKHNVDTDQNFNNNEYEYELSLHYIMKSENVDREKAIEIYNAIALENIKNTIDDLVKKGLVKLSGRTKDGEPKFKLTDLGKECASVIKNRENLKSSKKTKRNK